MDHKTLKDKILALYDGELDAEGKRETEAHIAICAECRELYTGWKETAKVFFKPSEVQSSEFFVRQVMDRIRGSETPAPVFSWKMSLRWFVPVVGFAAVFLMFLSPAPQGLTLDTLLAQETGENLTWLSSNNVQTQDETLQFVMEGQA